MQNNNRSNKLAETLKVLFLSATTLWSAQSLAEEDSIENLQTTHKALSEKLEEYKARRSLRECEDITEETSGKPDLFRIDNDTSIEFPSPEECHAYDQKEHAQHLTFYPEARVWKTDEQNAEAMQNYDFIRAPRKISEPVKLLAETEGIPVALWYSIINAESDMRCQNNPHSTAGGCLHLTRDTAYESIAKLAGTPYEKIFPAAPLIKQNQYAHGGTRLYIENPSTSKEDRNLTLNYHNMIREILYLEGKTATEKLRNDKELLLKRGVSNGTPVDTYAQWFFGTEPGTRFAELRRDMSVGRNEAAWKLYADTFESATSRAGNAIYNIGNRNIFFRKTFVDDAMLKLGIAMNQKRLNSPDISERALNQFERQTYKDIIDQQLNSGEYERTFNHIADLEYIFINAKQLSDIPWELGTPNPKLLDYIIIRNTDVSNWAPIPEDETPEEKPEPESTPISKIESYELAMKQFNVLEAE